VEAADYVWRYTLLEVHARKEDISELRIYSCCFVPHFMHKTLHTSYSALLHVHYSVLSLLCYGLMFITHVSPLFADIKLVIFV